MADECGFCNIRRPEGGTNCLILGEDWLEFCAPCGETVTLTHAETGEVKTLAALWADSQALHSEEPKENLS